MGCVTFNNDFSPFCGTWALSALKDKLLILKSLLFSPSLSLRPLPPLSPSPSSVGQND